MHIHIMSIVRWRAKRHNETQYSWAKKIKKIMSISKGKHKKKVSVQATSNKNLKESAVMEGGMIYFWSLSFKIFHDTSPIWLPLQIKRETGHRLPGHMASGTGTTVGG